MLKTRWMKVLFSSVAISAVLAGCSGETSDNATQEEQASQESAVGGAQEADSTSETEETESTSETEETESTSETEESESTETESSSDESSQASETDESNSPSPSVDMMTAVETFQSEYPDASIDEVDFEVDDQIAHYSISGYNGNMEYDLDIDAETGDILSQEEEEDDDNDQDSAIDFDAIIMPDEAIQIALDHKGSGIVEDWDLEVDDGRVEYEIDFKDDDGTDIDDITVDATTGEVIDS